MGRRLILSLFIYADGAHCEFQLLYTHTLVYYSTLEKRRVYKFNSFFMDRYNHFHTVISNVIL